MRRCGSEIDVEGASQRETDRRASKPFGPLRCVTVVSMPADEQVDLDPDPPLVPSFEAFFRANYAPLVRLLSVAADDAEDAVQDAFLQAHIHWLKIARYEDPKAWVRLVAVRKLLNREKGRSRGSSAVERLRASAASDDWSVELGFHFGDRR